MDSSRNSIDLLYLTNRNFTEKYNKSTVKRNRKDEIFYGRRILFLAKDILEQKKEYPESLEASFMEFARNTIEYFKFIDKKELIEKQYEKITPRVKKKRVVSLDELEKQQKEANKILLENKPKTIKIADVISVKKKKKEKKGLVFPTKKKYDISSLKFKDKGTK